MPLEYIFTFELVSGASNQIKARLELDRLLDGVALLARAAAAAAALNGEALKESCVVQQGANVGRAAIDGECEP